MIFLILVFSTILRLINLNQSLWLDEAINTLAAQKYSFFDMLTKYAPADFHPPGWFILIWVWTKIFGYSEIAVRMPSVIFGVATIWVVYLIGKKLVSKKLGLIAALFLCLNPLHIYYSQETRMYAMATLAVTVNIYLLIKVLKGEKLNLVFLILSNLFVLSSDYVAYLIFPMQFILFGYFDKKIIKKWLLALAASLVLGIWWLPVFFNQLNVGSAASSSLPSWKVIVGSFDFKSLPLTFIKFIIGRISLSNKFLYDAILLPLTSFFAFQIWRGIKASDSFSKKLLLTWIIIPPLLAIIISLFIPIYSYFRMLFILPSFIILVAAGVLSFKSKFKKIFVFTVILIEVFCSSVYLFNPLFQREDWKGLTNFFETKVPHPIILFESSGILPPFDYYAKGKLDGQGALKKFPSKNEGDVIDLKKMLQGKKDVYLVDYLVQISDPGRFVSKKLEDIGFKIVGTKNFTGVGFVYHFRRNG